MCQPYLEMPFGEGDAWEAHGAPVVAEGLGFLVDPCAALARSEVGGTCMPHPTATSQKAKNLSSQIHCLQMVSKHTSLLPGHLSRSLCLPTCHAFSTVALFPPLSSLGGGEWFPSAARTVTGAPLLVPRWLSVGCPLLGGCRILGPPPWRFWEPPALRPEVGLCLITAAKWLISSQWPIWRFNSSRSCFG